MKKHPLHLVNLLEIVLAFIAHVITFKLLGVVTGLIESTIVVYSIIKQTDGKSISARNLSFKIAVGIKTAFVWLHYMAFQVYLKPVASDLPFTKNVENWAWYTTAILFLSGVMTMALIGKETAEKANAEQIGEDLARADKRDEEHHQRIAAEKEAARLFELEKLRLELEVKNAGQTEAARIAAETEKAKLSAQVEAERIKSELKAKQLEAERIKSELDAKQREAEAKQREAEANRQELLANQQRKREEERRNKEEADKKEREAEANRIRRENEAKAQREREERQQQEARERTRAAEQEARRFRWMSSKPEEKYALYEAAYEAAKEACAEQYRQPTQAEVCETLGISTKSLQNFKNEHPKFFTTAAKAA